MILKIILKKEGTSGKLQAASLTMIMRYYRIQLESEKYI